MARLDSKTPNGPLSEKWTQHKSNINLVSPANKRLIDVIVVGTGLAGASASATLAELGYNVKTFCFQDSPRRAHSIAAQGESMLQRIIKEMGILPIVYSMIQSKVETIGLGKPMYIAWLRYLQILSINV